MAKTRKTQPFRGWAMATIGSINQAYDRMWGIVWDCGQADWAYNMTLANDVG